MTKKNMFIVFESVFQYEQTKTKTNRDLELVNPTPKILGIRSRVKVEQIACPELLDGPGYQDNVER